MATLTVRLLGAFAVDGVDLADLGSRKARQLLALLALGRGVGVRTDVIVEALWPTTPPTNPSDQVAVLASRIRRRIGTDRVQHGDGSYRLAYDWLDLDELDAVVAETERRAAAGNPAGAVATARIALALVRGRPTTLDLPGNWAQTEVAAVQRTVRRARQTAAGALVAAGHGLDAVAILDADVAAEPFDEHAVRLLMRAQMAARRPGEALAAYARLRDRLVDELGAEPAAETAALHVAILRGEQAATPTTGRSERAVPVGRRAELARLDELAARGTADTELVTVIGEAGIGKTTLLQAFVTRRRAAGDAVLAAACGRLERSAPLDAVLVALGEELRRLPPARAAEALGSDQSMLSPMLDPTLGGASTEPLLANREVGPAVLYTALAGVLARLPARGRVLLVLDDVHLAGSALADWLRFLVRRRLGLLVVAAARTGEGEELPATATIELGPFDADATAQLVGVARAEELHARSGGHPLFLSELMAAPPGEVPASLVVAVSARCAELGPAGDALRAAAVLGPRLDVDLLATILGSSSLTMLDHAELAARRGLLIEDGGQFRFRHELVRGALTADATAGRVALLHREAGRAMAGRPDADPLTLAEHARLGGDRPLAARSLVVAASRAGERFDHATAERLLDEALQLHPHGEARRARAHVRTRRGRYADALADVEAAQADGIDAQEVGAWAAYFDRDFDLAISYARAGELTAADPAVRVRCLMVGGRTLHARGELGEAEHRLIAALAAATGRDRITASAWLGILRAHQSRVDEALTLMRPAASHGAVEHTAATLHALLFSGHAQALAGRPAEALAALARYTEEVERRDMPRFGGRGVNFSGWVLRNIGAIDEGVEAHRTALALVESERTADVQIAALQDLADERLTAGDPDGAAAWLRRADAQATATLVFGWRLALKSRLLRARLALLTDSFEQAADLAGKLAEHAEALGVPRYAAPARLLAARARRRLGVPIDLDKIAADLAEIERTVAIEAWWWVGDAGADLRVTDWVDRAEASGRRLAADCGERSALALAHVAQQAAQWRRGAC
ncbi:MAG TPA: BTAD domain-containing putative transcriptional regulator [Sporichthyaceae bacterium]